MGRPLQLFAVCAPGLEPFLAEELAELGLAGKADRPASSGLGRREGAAEDAGGLEFCGSLADLYRANLHLATASRILVRCGRFCASSFAEFRRKAGRLAWERFLAPGQPVALRVTSRGSTLYHERALAERLAGAIADRLGRPAPVRPLAEVAGPRPVQLFIVRLVANHCLISADSSGEHLHRRGYRLGTAKAPLRETLGAAMLRAGRWSGASPLLDPFCGSGTIPIEAALRSRGLAPNRQRRFACEAWPEQDQAAWPRLRAAASRAARTDGPLILASDRDAGAIELARANAARAGVEEAIQFTRTAVSGIEPPSGPGLVVTNPPHGHRLSGGPDLRNLYAQFGHVLRAKCPGWTVVLLCGGPALSHATALALDRGIPLTTGGLRVTLHCGNVPS